MTKLNCFGTSSRLLALALAGLGASLTGACSLTLNFDECSVDADCIDAGYSCEDGKCVSNDDVGDDTTTDTGTDSGTETASETNTETDSGTETATETGTEGCTLHSECIAAHSDTWVCGVDGTCLNAITTECQIFHWPNDVPDDNVVIVGSIMATSPPFDTLVLPLQNAVEMAIDEFNDETELGNGQELAWIACNSSDPQGSTATALTAAEHLVAAGAPVIIGPIFSEEVLDVAEEVTIPAGVFLMTPTGSNAGITDLVDNDLVWRTISSDVHQAEAIADRIPDVVADKLPNLPLGPLDLTKMVIVHKSDAYGTDLAGDIFAALDPAISDITTVHPYDVPLDSMELQNEIAALLAPIAGSATPPELVVITGTSEAQAIVLIYLSLYSTLMPPPPPLPYFLVSHGAVPAMQYTISPGATMLGLQTQGLLYSYMEGVAPIIFDPVNYNEFNIRYIIRFMGQDAITTASLSYDALMVSAFAMAAVPIGDPITGANIAAQMEKLVDPDGTAINFGPGVAFIEQATNVLSVGGSVDLKGVSGDLQFNLETGEVRTDLLGWEVIPQGGDVTEPGLEPKRIYTLNDMANDGVWAPL